MPRHSLIAFLLGLCACQSDLQPSKSRVFASDDLLQCLNLDRSFAPPGIEKFIDALINNVKNPSVQCTEFKAWLSQSDRMLDLSGKDFRDEELIAAFEFFTDDILGHFSAINLSFNDLTNFSPFEIPGADHLIYLDVSSNTYNIGADSFLANRTKDLIYLDMSHNRFNGRLDAPVTDELGKLQFFATADNDLDAIEFSRNFDEMRVLDLHQRRNFDLRIAPGSFKNLVHADLRGGILDDPRGLAQATGRIGSLALSKQGDISLNVNSSFLFGVAADKINAANLDRLWSSVIEMPLGGCSIKNDLEGLMSFASVDPKVAESIVAPYSTACKH